MQKLFSRSLLFAAAMLMVGQSLWAQKAQSHRLDNGNFLTIDQGAYTVHKGSPQGETAFSGEQMRFFPGGRAFVRRSGRWGMCDLEGKMLVEPANGFFLVRPFREGLAWVSPASGNIALLKKDGKMVPLATRVQDATQFDRGICWIRIGAANADGGVWIPMDANGQMLMPIDKGGKLPYPTVGQRVFWLNQGGTQKTPAAPVKGGKWALVDHKGAFLLSYEKGADHAMPFAQGRSWANRGGKWSGDLLIGGQWALLDSTGKAVIDFSDNFDMVRNFSGGLAWVSKGGRWNGDQFRPGSWGLVEPSGKIRLEPSLKLEEVGDFSENRCWVSQQGGWGLLDGDGKFVLALDTTIKKARPVLSGVCWAMGKNDRWRLLDKDGKAVAGAEGFEDVRDFDNGTGFAKRNGQWGIVTVAGKWTAVPQAQDAHSFSEGLAAVQFPGGWGFITPKGQPAFEGTFKKLISDFLGGRAEVYIGELPFFLNPKGEIMAK